MMNKIMLTCKDLAWLSSQELDTNLPFMTRLKMKMHITMCKTCYFYRDQLKMIHALIRKIAPDFDSIADESVSLSNESKERIKKYIAEKSNSL